MPITLVTGLPGHAKTLYTLDRWRREAEKDRRPVFYNGIKGLTIPGWQEWEVDKWEELPAGALFIIDEAQFRFPVTGRGQTPLWVQKLATHRHLGLDFVVITQDPMLLDSFVRKLVDRHFHVVRVFGLRKATIYESVNGVRDDVAKPGRRSDLIRHDYWHNKEVYGWYQSAELHTVKRRLPARVYLLGAVVVAFPVICFFAWTRLNPAGAKARAESQLAAAGVSPPPIAGAGSSGSVTGYGNGGGAHGGTMTAAEYTAAYTPRLPGLPHTAPIYDGVTAPQQAPYPAACIASAKRCQCYSQQGTRLDMAEQLCRTLADGGFFLAWNAAGDRVQQPRADAGASAASSVQVGAAAGSFGPSEAPRFVAQAVDEDAGSLPRRVRRATQ